MPAFTSIALGVGLASTAVTTGMSFANMSKQGKLQKQAEADAAKAAAEARKKIEVNFYDQMAVKKEPYELEREAALAAGAQAIQAGQESERGVASTAGRVQMAQNEQQRKIAAAMGQEMTNIDQLIATEDSRLRDIGVQLDMGEAEGAQRAARDAAEAKAAATQQAMQGITSMATQGAQLAPLYGKNVGKFKGAMGKMEFTPEEYKTFGNVAEDYGMGTKISGGSNLDFEAIRQMNRRDYSGFMNSLNINQQKMLLDHPQFNENFNANPFKF